MYEAIEYTETHGMRLTGRRQTLLGFTRIAASLEEAEKTLNQVEAELAKDRRLLEKAKELRAQSG